MAERFEYGVLHDGEVAVDVEVRLDEGDSSIHSCRQLRLPACDVHFAAPPDIIIFIIGESAIIFFISGDMPPAICCIMWPII